MPKIAEIPYDTTAQIIARTGKIKLFQIGLLIITVGFTLWSCLARSTAAIACAAVVGGVAALSIYDMNLGERIFLLDVHKKQFIIVEVTFGRLDSYATYKLDSLIRFELENNSQNDCRIVALMEDGEKLPLQKIFSDTYLVGEVIRLNKSLCAFRESSKN